MPPYLSPKGSHRRFVPHTVLFLTGNANYSYIHLTSGEVVLMSHTLKYYERKWPWLMRIHKQVLVNPDHVQQAICASCLTSPSYLVMSNQTQLPIARRRLRQVVEWIKPFNVRLIRVRTRSVIPSERSSKSQIAPAFR